MDWRLLQWSIGAGAVAFLLGGVYWMGGRAWTAHFAFPIGFLLLAVPWPTRLETILIQSSTGFVVRAVVEALRWMGVAAWNAGNVIQLPNIAIGVDEACSGLRSFQGAVICGLFLGEMARLSRWRRVALLLVATVIALVLNGVRTLILAVVAGKHGEAMVNFWHDGTGMITLFFTFGLLWVAARLLRQERVARPPSKIAFAQVGLPIVIVCAAWFVLVESVSGLWFVAREKRPGESLWTFNASGAAGLRPEPISPRTQAILRYDRGEAYRRSLPDGTEWWVYALEWDRDGGGSPLARFHSPEVCLPAAGLTLKGEGSVLYPLDERTPFRSYEFEWLGKPVHIFSSFVSSNGGTAAGSMMEFDLTWQKRLHQAWDGKRPAEQKVFQVLISGAPTRKAAEMGFLQFVSETVRAGK